MQTIQMSSFSLYKVASSRITKAYHLYPRGEEKIKGSDEVDANAVTMTVLSKPIGGFFGCGFCGD